MDLKNRLLQGNLFFCLFGEESFHFLSRPKIAFKHCTRAVQVRQAGLAFCRKPPVKLHRELKRCLGLSVASSLQRLSVYATMGGLAEGTANSVKHFDLPEHQPVSSKRNNCCQLRYSE